ncbi:MAG: HAD-IA family hydrolase [Deltaproteobacteria bacterium]|nr:HAD-IA family hydrolase [Deltaproteobacteria bacterium]
MPIAGALSDEAVARDGGARKLTSRRPAMDGRARRPSRGVPREACRARKMKLEAVTMRDAVRLLVFDLDGTLIDSKEDIANSVNHALGEFGYHALPHEKIYSYVGDGATMLIRRAVGDDGNGVLSSVLDAFLSDYRRRLLDTTLPYPGVAESLEEWAGRYDMAVLTNKPLDMTHSILSGLSLDRYFADVIGGDSLDSKKPNPEGLIRIMRRRSSQPGETIMVGDSRNDVLAGRGAGVRSCGVTYGLGAAGFEEHPPDFTIDSFPELFEHIHPKTY